MKLSVIIPTYNRSDLLADTINSLCDQYLLSSEYEILVVDNNSTDDTYETVKESILKFPKNSIRYVYESRQGDFFARNRGAEEAVGEYLVFTDDDAVFDKNYLDTILKMFETFPTIGAVGTKIVVQWEGGTPANWIKPYEYLLGALDYKPDGFIIKSKGLYINNGSLAIKRNLYIAVGGNNPGQIGDYLIGDAEAGLCRKLHALNMAIAFTDDTVMYHRQFVGKHDTLVDIRRRVENNGIASAFTDTYVNQSTKALPIACLYARYLYYKLTMRKRKALRTFLELCQSKKYNEYVDRYQHDEKLKSLISQTKYDWE